MAAAAYRFATITNRNNSLANLAASDAFHDFDEMGRVSKENQVVKNVLNEIWKDEKKIGTLPDPTSHKSEEALFAEIVGAPIATFRKPGGEGTLNILSAGTNSIEYEWKTVVAYEAVGEEMRYKPSVDLFNAITGDSKEKTLYFMIDAINVSIHKALIHEQGAAPEKSLVYLETRERLNDPADNRRMDHYVGNSKKSKVSLSILYDEYPHRVVYPVITSTSTQANSLFNSIFTVSLDAKKSKEGLASSTLTFQRNGGATLRAVTVQNGVAENDNTVNSLYRRLVDFFRGAKTPTALEDYFITLQQKRSGDWLQVLASLDTRRFPGIPASAPIFLASLDRLCVLYGLCAGANMIYTFQQGNSYCFTVFRRKQKLSAAERRKETAAALRRILEAHLGTASSLDRAPIAAGGLPYTDAVGTYLRFIASKFDELKRKVEEVYAVLSAKLPDLAQSRSIDAGAFNAPLGLVVKPLYDILLFSRAFPPTLEAIADVAVKPADIKDTDESISAASTRIDLWERVVGMLTDMFQSSDANWASSTETMTKALEDLFKKFEASNKERDAVLQSIDLKEELYDQPLLAVLQQLEVFLPASLLKPVGALFDIMLEKANGVLVPGVSSLVRKRAEILRMNAAIGKYVLLKDVTVLPVGATQALSGLLQKTFVNPTPERKKNAFAVHRIIARAYQEYVSSNARAALIQAFRAAYTTASAAGPSAAGPVQQGGQVRLRTARQAPLEAGVIAPLLLARRVLRRMTYLQDAHPFEVSPRLFMLLNQLIAPSSVRKVLVALPPGIPIQLFRAVYYETVGYFLFFMVPSIDEFGRLPTRRERSREGQEGRQEGLPTLFSTYDIDHVKELGGILQSRILGPVAREPPAVEAEYLKFFEFIAGITTGGGVPKAEKVEAAAIEVMKQQEMPMSSGTRQASKRRRSRSRTSSTVRTKSRSRSRTSSTMKTKSRSRTSSTMKSKSRSGSKLRMTKRRRSATKAVAPEMEVEVAAHGTA